MLKSIIVVYDSAEINGGAAHVAIRSAIALKDAGYDVYFFAATGPINAEMIQKGICVKCLYMNDINHGSKITAMIHGVWNGKAKKSLTDSCRCFRRKKQSYIFTAGRKRCHPL